MPQRLERRSARHWAIIFWEGAPLDFGRSREVDICHGLGSTEYNMEVSFYVSSLWREDLLIWPRFSPWNVHGT